MLAVLSVNNGGFLTLEHLPWDPFFEIKYVFDLTLEVLGPWCRV